MISVGDLSQSVFLSFWYNWKKSTEFFSQQTPVILKFLLGIIQSLAFSSQLSLLTTISTKSTSSPVFLWYSLLPASALSLLRQRRPTQERFWQSTPEEGHSSIFAILNFSGDLTVMAPSSWDSLLPWCFLLAFFPFFYFFLVFLGDCVSFCCHSRSSPWLPFLTALFCWALVCILSPVSFSSTRNTRIIPKSWGPSWGVLSFSGNSHFNCTGLFCMHLSLHLFRGGGVLRLS